MENIIRLSLFKTDRKSRRIFQAESGNTVPVFRETLVSIKDRSDLLVPWHRRSRDPLRKMSDGAAGDLSFIIIQGPVGTRIFLNDLVKQRESFSGLAVLTSEALASILGAGLSLVLMGGGLQDSFRALLVAQKAHSRT